MLCLFLGTAALAGIGSLSASLIAALDAQGRQMLGGDVELRVSQRRATVEEMAAFAGQGRVSETVSMRRDGRAPDAAPVLVDLRGVDERLATGRHASGWRPARSPIGRTATRSRSRPALADRLGVKVGDMLRLGAARLEVIGLIAAEPDRLGAGFTLGPPVLVDMAGLDATRLVQPGSLYESHYRIVLPRTGATQATSDLLARRFAQRRLDGEDAAIAPPAGCVAASPSSASSCCSSASPRWPLPGSASAAALPPISPARRGSSRR